MSLPPPHTTNATMMGGQYCDTSSQIRMLGVEWNNLAQDRGLWRAVVYMLICCAAT